MLSGGLAMQGSLCLALLGTIVAKVWGCSQRGAQGTSRSLGGIGISGIGSGMQHSHIHPCIPSWCGWH